MLRVQVAVPAESRFVKGEQQPAAPYAQPLSFISAKGTELCVVCHKDTGVSVREPTHSRRTFVPGVGQCCEDCSTDW